MGKTTRWIRSLFRPKKTPSSSSTGSASLRQQKPHGASTHTPNSSEIPYPESLDANKHAIAVAAATAAVAEAALAAAHAAAEVVRLTAGGGHRVYHDADRRRVAAAVRIQSAFRAYLAKRALKALKGLVKLQALVRGRIVRKQSADMLRRMQAMARVQARACASRSSLSASPHSSTRSTNSHNHPVPKSTSAKGGLIQERFKALNWLENWMDDGSWSSKQCRPDDERSDKILEVDTWKPRVNPSPSNKSTNSTPTKPWNPRSGSREVLPLGSMILREAEKTVSTAENTPRARSPNSRPGSSHRRSPFSEYSRSVYGDYTSFPNYMANTESSRAKLRSHSAPRQRNLGSSRLFWDYSDTVSERGFRN